MIYDHITERTPIDKGWSGDQKYRITDDRGCTYLLRVSPAERYDQKLRQFRRMEQVAALGVPMCAPVEFGLCAEGVYSIQGWIDGADAREALPTLPEDAQYAYGLDAGRILKMMHTLPAPAGAESWADRFGRKIDRKIALYEGCSERYKKGELFLEHIAGYRHLLSDREQTWQHGDYHSGNMMIDHRGRLTVIDFDRDDFGDPWEEFNRIVWCAQDTPRFAAGMVDGYFDGSVPGEFWDLLALYICSNTLSSLPWAVNFGPREVSVMRKQAEDILKWYDDFRTTVPSWYSDK